MKLIPPISALTFLFCLLASLPATAADRVALLIGNADYTHARALNNPINDATKLAKRFEASDYRTFSVTDASVEEMSGELELFYEAARDAEMALIYFAGHGIEYDGKNYLLPVDADLDIDESVSGDALTAAKRTVLKRQAIPLDDVLDDLGDTGAKLKLIVLDCCRDDPLPDRSWLSRSGAGGTLAGVREGDLSEGTMLVYSTAPGKRASDGARGGNSPFTAAMLESLTPGATILNVFTQIAGMMSRQEPWIKFDGSGKAMLGFGSIALIPGSAPELASVPEMGPQKPKPKPAPVPAPTDLPRGFTNSLGMKMVPVPGTKVLFCEHETRVQDFRAFVEAIGYRGGDKPVESVDKWLDFEYEGHAQGPDHPVVNVSWDDAKAFCEWLSKKEGKEYRLPTDHEWSVAVGIGDREDSSASPSDKNATIEGVYPWGSTWPPPSGSGNFSGSESAARFKLEDYRDRHPFTAPVESYEKSLSGLYDLSGNVWEWCEDAISSEVQLLRGSAWDNTNEPTLLSSRRKGSFPTTRNYRDGFRVVVVGVGG